MGRVGRIEQLQGRESRVAPAERTRRRPTAAACCRRWRTLHIQGGRKEKIRPGDVLGALTGDLGCAKEQVGKINVNEFSTYVAVERGIAERAPRS